ncbi:GFA family protein [Dyella sp. C9]|uniref:GFA family protein n=1 Tax=Dyella sp. C9 TaxID=2202154 RepID=UPI000DEFB4C6|nr:GFA family protein [Dyella sp. C9]
MLEGSCHCGCIAFDVEGQPVEAFECNCTYCSRRGLLLWFVPRDQFHLRTPEEAMSSYRFNRHVIDHRFCPQCGVQAFAFGQDSKTGGAVVAVNVRCLEGVDLAAIERKPFDGRHRL